MRLAQSILPDTLAEDPYSPAVAVTLPVVKFPLQVSVGVVIPVDAMRFEQVTFPVIVAVVPVSVGAETELVQDREDRVRPVTCSVIFALVLEEIATDEIVAPLLPVISGIATGLLVLTLGTKEMVVSHKRVVVSHDQEFSIRIGPTRARDLAPVFTVVQNAERRTSKIINCAERRNNSKINSLRGAER